jgi:hypothetical protein
MKKTFITLCVLALVGCSSTKQVGLNPGDVTPVKEQRLSTDFKREGVRVTYTFGGEVEKIEAFGYAEVWRGQYSIVAEANAKDKLIKFLRGENVDTQRMTKVIAKSIERSQDNTLNKFRTVDGTINTSDVEVEKESNQTAKPNEDENSKENSALRKASVNNAMQVVSTITVSSSGKLTAVYKERSGVVDDGKTYMAVYVWTPKQQNAARIITNIMDAR